MVSDCRSTRVDRYITHLEEDVGEYGDDETWQRYCSLRWAITDMAVEDARKIYGEPAMFRFKAERLVRLPGLVLASHVGESTMRYYLQVALARAGVKPAILAPYVDVVMRSILCRYSLPLLDLESLHAQFDSDSRNT